MTVVMSPEDEIISEEVVDPDAEVPDDAIIVSSLEADNLLPDLPEGQQFYLHDWMFPALATTNERGEVVEEPPKPWFSVAEVAKVFFGKTADWLRWRMKPTKDHPYGYFVLDGKQITERRIRNNENPRYWHRYYTLADIERMAHAVAQNGGMDARAVSAIVIMCIMCARINGVEV